MIVVASLGRLVVQDFSWGGMSGFFGGDEPGFKTGVGRPGRVVQHAAATGFESVSERRL